jgi:tetratricopeptide (TPR) repeat protein
MKYLLLLVVAVILLNSALVLGQDKQADDAVKLEELRRSGIEALYNLDYEKARRDFTEITKLFPANPTGPQLLAARIWLKTLYESRRLQSSLYNSESFYTKGDDKVDPKVIAEFRSMTREAKRLADARVKANPRDVEAIDALAAVAGLKASFEEAVERRHFAALRDGSEAVDRHRDVLRLDPNYIDAQLTIGLYEYVLGSLPLPAKLLAGLTGARGSKKRGLAALERVAREGRWSRDDAKSLLILLYTREKRYSDVLTFARELSAKYPRNYLFRLEAADALVALAAQERRNKNVMAAEKAEREAFAYFDDLLRDRSVRETVSRALDLVHFKYGEVLLRAGERERAAREFLAATRVEHAEPALVTIAHLHAARAFDLIGKRDEALAHYKQVLARPDIFDAHDDAKKGLKQAFKNDTE